ncbi:type IV fimbrial biogenesis protein FimT [Modicisalibacter muralis]|uniref:Type II secretion system protein H n=1 Tax=Modicisalibacter muralis TaxID=119000 RepID=A0A1G9QKP0_9GAMM|nr:GspH/FimT family pseudopilin [Halomonas muralis]SDM11566.1 type IV fimbrial biogenesis protein FimT [Halomonas muralis]
MRVHKSSGFTLIELIVVVALIAILATWVVPGFQGLIARTTLDSEIERVRQALLTARAEAAQRRAPVRVCPTEDELECSSDWSVPLMIFVDANDNGERNASEELVSISQRSANAEITITPSDELGSGIAYRADGFTDINDEILSFKSNDLPADEAKGICIEYARVTSASLSVAKANCG